MEGGRGEHKCRLVHKKKRSSLKCRLVHKKKKKKQFRTLGDCSDINNLPKNKETQLRKETRMPTADNKYLRM